MYVELRHINKRFGGYRVSDDVSFSVDRGKLIGLLGPSGSGKTTILRMIAGLETPDSGEILIDGKVMNEVPASRRGIGFVFQNYALFRYMTVEENIGFGLKIRKVPGPKIRERVNELLGLVGLEGLNRRYPSQLSGGQKQRVAFARAIAPNPQLLLLDEPFAALDARVRQELRLWLKSMIEKLGITSIFVTHDQDEAIEIADEIIITNQGRVEQIGDPLSIYQNPETDFTASFIGQATIIDNYGDFRHFRRIPEAEHAIVRPEFIRLAKLNEVMEYKSSAERGTVEQKLFRGSHIDLKVRVNGDLLTARRNLDEADVSVGEAVDVFLYRILVTAGRKVYLLTNESLREEDVVI